MKRKIYISINLPKRTRKSLARVMERWEGLPIKWTKEDNLHLSLLFLGFVDDDTSLEVCQKLTALCEQEEMFDILLNTIKLSPSPEDAKRVVLTGEPSEELRLLMEHIEKELGIFTSAKKEFRPHILLGKVRKKQWDELPEKPEVKRDFPLMVGVESVDVMASDFESEEGEYVIVESCPLNA
jgi:2'-5' RNA ligase